MDERKSKTILIVDDDEVLLRIFTRILERNGYNPDTAKTGEEALAKLRANHYSAALIDVRLPDADGIDLLKKIPEKSSKIVKIVITGSVTEENHRKALENGADAFLEKPIEPKKLVEIITSKLDNSSTEES